MIKYIIYLFIALSSTAFASNNETKEIEYRYGSESMVYRYCCMFKDHSDANLNLEKRNLLGHLNKTRSKYIKKFRKTKDEYQLFIEYINEIRGAPLEYYKYLSDVRVSPAAFERTRLLHNFNCITTEEELKEIKEGYSSPWKEWFPSNYLKYIKRGGSPCEEWFEPNDEYKKMMSDLEDLKLLSIDTVTYNKDFNLVLNMYYALIKSKFVNDYSITPNSLELFRDINNSCELALSIKKNKPNMNFIDFLESIEGGESVIRHGRYGNTVAFTWAIYSQDISCEAI